mmetsp:Transcript_56527/g.112225  ORF Transcript_56527/g.112225 Transcript_56527/m.112225 type:complete len:116 (-) Transcript_56527:731-1078(-)
MREYSLPPLHNILPESDRGIRIESRECACHGHRAQIVDCVQVQARAVGIAAQRPPSLVPGSPREIGSHLPSGEITSQDRISSARDRIASGGAIEVELNERLGHCLQHRLLRLDYL